MNNKNDATGAVVVILLLAGVGYYLYKQNKTKVDTINKWWSIF
jgi:hypothetical protein